MSTIVLFHYYDWLKGNKESWREWEKKPARPFPNSADQQFADKVSDRPQP